MAINNDSFVSKLLPINGVTPRHIATWIAFGWAHLPTTWIPSYALVIGVIAIYGLPLFMDSDKAFNRIFLVGLLLVVSQHLIPTAWDLLKSTKDFQYVFALFMWYGLDYALAAGGWSGMDKKSSSSD